VGAHFVLLRAIQVANVSVTMNPHAVTKRQLPVSGGILDNAGKAIGWLDRLKLSCEQAEPDS
jgi:hypothetical protein